MPDEPADDEPMFFNYSSSVNISFQGREESGYTWGEWRAMNSQERDAAYEDFVWNTLGLDIGPARG